MGCNWSKLFSQNRVKAIGVPWNDAEIKAIYELKIPAEFVRNGCLTLDEYLGTSKELKDKRKKVRTNHYNTKQSKSLELSRGNWVSNSPQKQQS